MSLVNQALEQISAEEKSAGESQCFVGHDFGQKDLRAKLERALKQLGLQPYFADREVTGDYLLTKICKKILITRASIVDLTRANPNVYFELGLAVGLNKPVFLVLKDGESVPPLLESFVKIRFTHYAALEKQIVAGVPEWLSESIEHHLSLNNHCHFVNTLCADRHRVTPRRRYLLIDQREAAGPEGRLAPTFDPDLRVEVQGAMDRFQFGPVFLDGIAADSSFRVCDYCRALRDSNFALCHVDQHSSNDVYLLLGLVTGLGIPSLLMIREERDGKGNLLWEVPTMLKGLDAFYYTHLVEIEARLGDAVQGFLDRHAGGPLLNKILLFPEEFRDRPEEIFDKEDFGASGLAVIEAAAAEAEARGQNYVTVEHVLDALTRLGGELVDAFLRHVGAPAEAFRARIEERVEAVPRRAGEAVAVSPAVKSLIKSASHRAREEGGKTVEAVDILQTLAHDEESVLAALMRDFGVASPVLAVAASLAALEHVSRPPAEGGGMRLSTYMDRFSESGRRILQRAVDESKRREQRYVSVEHIVEAAITMEAELFGDIVRELSVDPQVVKMRAERLLDNARSAKVTKGVRIAPETIDVFKKSMERARAMGRKTIRATDLLLVLSCDENGPLVKMIAELGVDAESLAEEARARIRAREQSPEPEPGQYPSAWEVYQERFTEDGWRIFIHARDESRRRGQGTVAVEHIIDGLAKEEAALFTELLRDLSLDPPSVASAIARRLDDAPRHVGLGTRVMPDTIGLLKSAMERAYAQGRRKIAPTDLLMVAAQNDTPFLEILKQLGADPLDVLAKVRERVHEYERSVEARRSAVVAEFQRITAEGRQGPAGARKGIRILIASNEAATVNSLGAYLGSQGYEVDSAADGAQAIRLLESYPHPLIICDYNLRGVGGMEILKRAKELRPTCEVILMAYVTREEKDLEATEAGALDILLKPIDFKKLQELLERGLGRGAAK